MFRIVISSIFFFISIFSFSQQLIINEVSQGTGFGEYVEFVVIGTPTCVTPVPCIDLRKVIMDDNNGYFAPGSGTGIAPGAIRFGNIPFWQCIPQGTYIVIYNDADANSNIPANDLSMSDGNCRLIIPVSSNLMESTAVSPTSTLSTYPPDPDWVTGGTWSPLGMSNTNDSFQIPDLANNGVPLHSVSWGNNSSNTIIYFSGGAASKVFSFTNNVSNDWNIQANWTSGNVPANETPGAPNNAQNDTWIGSMNPQCGVGSVMTVTIAATNETCLNACDGTAISTVTNGVGPFTYIWSNGAVTQNISNLCPGNFTVEVIGSNGCSAEETVTIQQGSAPSNASIQNAGPFEVTEAQQQIIAVNSGGVWSADCGSCLSSTGVFNPQTAGVGTWQVCYQLGSGNCSDTQCISIIVSPGCPPQVVTETQQICPGDSLLIYGNWEQTAGNYIEAYLDASGCDSTHIIELSFYSAPDVNEVETVCEFDSVLVFGTWYFDSEVVSQIEQTSNGCEYQHTVTIIQENCLIEPSVIYIPNSFTPNGDLVNDLFKIEVLGGEIEEGYIFNRWGNVVCTFSPYDLIWDGYDEKTGLRVQDGVYTYIVYIKPAESNRERLHGFVTVIR